MITLNRKEMLILAWIFSLLGWSFQLVGSYILSVFFCRELSSLSFHFISFFSFLICSIGTYFSWQALKRGRPKAQDYVVMSLSSLLIIVVIVSDFANTFLEICR